MSFNFFFILAHNFSIGFKSSKYDGRNKGCDYKLEELTDELIIRNKGMYEVIKLEKGKIF